MKKELTWYKGFGFQWRRLVVQALYVSIENPISTRPLLVWRCWNREDHAHGHVL